MVTPLLPDPIHLLSEDCSDFVLSVFSTSEIYNIQTTAPNMTAAMFREILVLIVALRINKLYGVLSDFEYFVR